MLYLLQQSKGEFSSFKSKQEDMGEEVSPALQLWSHRESVISNLPNTAASYQVYILSVAK